MQKVVRVCEMFPKPLRVVSHVGKRPHVVVFLLCVCMQVSNASYLSAHTHGLLPGDKRGHTVNHCWCDDGQQTEGTMHQAAICRGWCRPAPLAFNTQAHTEKGKKKNARTLLDFDSKQKSCDSYLHKFVL